MGDRLAPSARIVVTVAFLIGLGILLFDPFSWDHISGTLRLLAGAVGVVLITSLFAMLLGRGGVPGGGFRRDHERSELMARMPPGQEQPSEFEELVIEAIDELPPEFHEVLADVPIVISRLGAEVGAYGLYVGDTIARDNFRDHIVIYEDTLERDFGWDHDLLRAQIVRTVRHEVAHHLGWDEQGVRDLGL